MDGTSTTNTWQGHRRMAYLRPTTTWPKTQGKLAPLCSEQIWMPSQWSWRTLQRDKYHLLHQQEQSALRQNERRYIWQFQVQLQTKQGREMENKTHRGRGQNKLSWQLWHPNGRHAPLQNSTEQYRVNKRGKMPHNWHQRLLFEYPNEVIRIHAAQNIWHPG